MNLIPARLAIISASVTITDGELKKTWRAAIFA
jgi:hypothetical protein